MRSWLITIGEPLPIDGNGDRLLRTGTLAERLACHGHNVVWWTSSFDHVRKTQRRWKQNENGNHSQIQLLYGPSYRRNISWSRYVNHRRVAKEFHRLAPSEPVPDVILCSWPIVELCVEAVRYGRLHNVPVVLDIRDMWPDVILDVVPRWLKPLGELSLRKLYSDAAEAASCATAITGISDPVVDWGIRFCDRSRSDLDRYFPMGYSVKKITGEQEKQAEAFWVDFGIHPSSDSTKEPQFIACFFGAIGRHFEIETIVRAAAKLGGGQRNIKFVLCGEGPELERWRQLAWNLDNVILPGWVDAAQIQSLMQLASIGLAPYRSSWDFRMSIPNKPIEYLSAGLPVVSSLQGTLAELLASNQVGITYKNESPDDLARILADCYDHPAYLAEMSHRASTLYQQRFRADTVYAEMTDYLLGIAGAHTHKLAA